MRRKTPTRVLDTDTPPRDGNNCYVLNVILNGLGKDGRQTRPDNGMLIGTPSQTDNYLDTKSTPRNSSSGLC
jgi:hypothetical protein